LLCNFYQNRIFFKLIFQSDFIILLLWKEFILMFLLIALISLFMALLSVPFLSQERQQTKTLIFHGFGAIILSVGLWMLYFFLLNSFVSHFIIGLILLGFSFARLGVFSLPKYLESGESIAVVHMLVMAVISAMSGLPPVESLVAFLLFIPFLLIGIPLLKAMFNRYRRKKVENVKLLLELFAVLDGIFVFIITLIITSDRVRFLEKIADQLF